MSPHRDAAPRNVPWPVKATVLLSGLFVALSFSVVSPILPRMSSELATGATGAYLVKMVAGVIGLAMVIGAPLAGLALDRLGRRPVLVTAGLVYAAAGVAPALLPDLPEILAARFLFGLAAIAIGTGGAVLVGDYFEGVERHRLMGALVAVAMVGALVVTPVAGALGDLGWRTPFWIYLLGVTISVLGALGWSPAPLHPLSHTPGAVGGSLVSGPFPWRLTLLALAVGIVTYLPVIYMPFRLREIGIRNPSSIGALLTFDSLVGAVLATQFGRARRWLSSPACFALSFGSIGLGLAIVAMANAAPAVIAGLFVVGLGMAWLAPNLLSNAASHDAARGRNMGTVKSAQAIAPAIGVSALEPLVRSIGTEGVLLVTAAFSISVCVGLAVLSVHVRLAAPERGVRQGIDGA
jgi:MFS family permease